MKCMIYFVSVTARFGRRSFAANRGRAADRILFLEWLSCLDCSKAWMLQVLSRPVKGCGFRRDAVELFIAIGTSNFDAEFSVNQGDGFHRGFYFCRGVIQHGDGRPCLSQRVQARFV